MTLITQLHVPPKWMLLFYLGWTIMRNCATHKGSLLFDLIEIIKMVLDLKALDGIKHAYIR